VGLREAFIDRVVGRLDKPTQVKLHWRARLRAGGGHARVMSQLVQAGDTAIDIGANWGLYTIGLSSLVGPAGHVISVEPGPELSTLRSACARSTNVEIFALALSDRDGVGHMEVPDGSNTSSSALAHVVDEGSAAQSALQIRLARLDDLAIPGSSRLSFIKCDVEGHEDAVLRGGETRIRERMPALLIEIEERHREQPVSVAFDLLSSWGYDAYALTPRGIRALDEFDVERDQRAHLVDGDLPVPTPSGYINDFLFVASGARPPSGVA
jgi:FkbM family methyltransferase